MVEDDVAENVLLLKEEEELPEDGTEPIPCCKINRGLEVTTFDSSRTCPGISGQVSFSREPESASSSC